MAEERTLRCDICHDGGGTVDRYVLDFGPQVAWVADLCTACRLETIGQVSAMLGVDPVSSRIARARRADYLGESPYKAAAGVSLTDVRAWARRNEVPCPERGRIRGSVINLYKACQEKGDRYLQSKEAQLVIAGLEG